MKLALRLALAALACALVVLGLRLLVDPGKPAGSREVALPRAPDGSLIEKSAAPAEVDQAPSVEAVRTNVVVEDAPAARFVLVVVDERATPIARSHVAIRDASDEVQQALSDVDGRVHFAPRSGAGEVFVVCDGFELVRETLQLDAGERTIRLATAAARVAGFVTVNGEPPREPLTLELERGDAQLDELEFPLALRDEFRAFTQRRVETDARGGFAFERLDAAWSGRLIAPTGYCEPREHQESFGKRQFDLPRPKSDLRLELERLPRLVGRVVDSTGAPGEKGERVIAYVQWLDGGGTGTSAQLDAKGRFEFVLRAPAMREVKLTLESDRGQAAVSKTNDDLQRLENGDLDFGLLTLEAGRALRVRVVDLSGAPVAKARARIVGESNWSDLGASGVGDAPTSANGSSQLRVVAPGFWARDIDVLLPSSDEILVVLAPANQLTVQVRDAGGLPVNDVLVRLQSADVRLFPESNSWIPNDTMVGLLKGLWRGGGEEVGPHALGWTDAAPLSDGQIVVQGLATNADIEVLVLDALQRELARRRPARLGEAEQRELEIVLDVAPRTLAGRVVDRNGKPLRGVELSARGEGGLDALTATTTDGGRFELRGITAPRLRLEASVRDFVRSAVHEFAVDGSEVELVLERGRSLLVEIVDATGRALEGGTISARNARWNGVWRPYAVSGANAEFALLPNEALTLTLDLNQRRFDQEIGPLEELVRFVAPRPGTLSVRLADPAALAHVRPAVVIRSTDSIQPLVREFVDGRLDSALDLGPLSPGEFQVALFTIELDGTRSMVGSPKSVVIEPEEQATIVLP